MRLRTLGESSVSPLLCSSGVSSRGTMSSRRVEYRRWRGARDLRSHRAGPENGSFFHYDHGAAIILNECSFSKLNRVPQLRSNCCRFGHKVIFVGHQVKSVGHKMT